MDDDDFPAQFPRQGECLVQQLLRGFAQSLRSFHMHSNPRSARKCGGAMGRAD
jgi:hypothetical protein